MRRRRRRSRSSTAGRRRLKRGVSSIPKQKNRHSQSHERRSLEGVARVRCDGSYDHVERRQQEENGPDWIPWHPEPDLGALQPASLTSTEVEERRGSCREENPVAEHDIVQQVTI